MTTLDTGRGSAADDPRSAHALRFGEAGHTEQPRLTRNDYSPLEPPTLGEWTPTLSVSVVIPAHGQPEKLALVLASLAAQSYPAHLTEVVVVDDASPEPLSLPEVRPENTRLITSEPGGWGSAHAVNSGAAASSGQVVLRLDADMLVYREHVESQMRWHHLLDYGVSMGHKLFVDFDPKAMTPEYVRDEVAQGRADVLFDRETADPHWVEDYIAKRDALRSADRHAYKVFIGATGSLHRSLLEAAGGLDRDLILGGDTELGYRLSQQGAVFIPDLETSSWHLGRTQMQTRREAGMRYRGPYVSNRVPDHHLRRKRHDRVWDVPYADVVLDVGEATLEQVDATASALLSGTTPDIRVWMVGAWGELDDGRRAPLDEELLDLRLVKETFRGDARVRFVDQAPSADPQVPFVLRVPVGTTPVRTLVADLIGAADKNKAGLLCAPLPGAARADDGVLRLERRAAFARALHLEPGAEGRQLDRAVDEVYGTYWMPGNDCVVSAATEESAETKSPQALRRELDRALSEVERMRGRAKRAERKLRWFTPGLARRVLRRIAR